MTKWFILLLLSCILFSCNKSGAGVTSGSTGPVINPQNPPSTLRSGNFINGAHPTVGKALLVNDSGNKLLELQNFKTEQGPDLYVYLATNESASSFINLGKLKMVEGDQTYAISGMPDFDRYPYVLIWCQQFGVLFGSAQLQ